MVHFSVCQGVPRTKCICVVSRDLAGNVLSVLATYFTPTAPISDEFAVSLLLIPHVSHSPFTLFVHFVVSLLSLNGCWNQRYGVPTSQRYRICPV